MYIVIFNVGNRDVTLMTNNHGFLQEFYSYEIAEEYAQEWIDNDQFRNFKVYKQEKN